MNCEIKYSSYWKLAKDHHPLLKKMEITAAKLNRMMEGLDKAFNLGEENFRDCLPIRFISSYCYWNSYHASSQFDKRFHEIMPEEKRSFNDFIKEIYGAIRIKRQVENRKNDFIRDSLDLVTLNDLREKYPWGVFKEYGNREAKLYINVKQNGEYSYSSFGIKSLIISAKRVRDGQVYYPEDQVVELLKTVKATVIEKLESDLKALKEKDI